MEETMTDASDSSGTVGMTMHAFRTLFLRLSTSQLGSQAQSERKTRAARFGNAKGIAFIELMLVVGLIGLMASVSLPHIDPHKLDLAISVDGLSGNLKMARTWSIGRGVHFQVTLTASSYTVQRLSDPDADGIWTPDPGALVQDFILPDRISLSISGADTLEFNTRGLLVPEPGEPLAAIETITVTDTYDARTRQIVIWPSGQILDVS
jgi:Tfp pilus assembly protein FimT